MQVNGGGYRASKWTLPGAGLRAGYEFHLNNRFSLALFLDAAATSDSPTIGTDDLQLWSGNWLVPAFGSNLLIFF